jgi:hypothetical protein
MKRKRTKRSSPVPRKRRKVTPKKRRRKKKKGGWVPYDKWLKNQKKNQKFVNLCSDEECVINEYQLQKTYHKWYREKWPYAVSSSCPYTSMNGTTKKAIIQRQKEKNKGYLRGYPDYVHHDPRLEIDQDDDYIYLEFVPAEFFEFKHPSGDYDLRPCQRTVKKALERRGHRVHKVDDLKKAKKLTKRHRKGVPLYKGRIAINKRTFKFTFPKSPPKVRLPTLKEKKKRRKDRSK